MQLNNTKGNIINIIAINKETGRTIYKVYENVIYNENGLVKEFFSKEVVKIFSINYEDTTALTLQEKIENEIAQQIIDYENDNYAISSDAQNWLFPERAIRIIIDNAKSMRAFYEDVNYRALMNGIVEKHQGFIINNTINSIVYVNTLDDTEIAIVQPYIYDAETNPTGWIYIEPKQ